MYCRKCGADLGENGDKKICPKCGTPSAVNVDKAVAGKGKKIKKNKRKIGKRIVLTAESFFLP